MSGEQEAGQSIAILSLVVAALAVFVGPLISWFVSKRQLASSLEVANKQVVAPMRQAWINNLRDVLSELLSSALHYYVSGFEDRSDAEYLPQTLHVRSPKEMRRNYPVGTRFRIYAKLTDKEGGSPFLHTHHSWDYDVLD
jgi:Zn-dependent protease with chaperone function